MTEFDFVLPGEAPSCRFQVGCGLFPSLAAGLQGFSKIVLITEDKLLPLWGEKLLQAFEVQPLVLTVPSGENSKTREMKARLEDEMAAAGVDRSSLVLALGGGMICDLAAFTASTYMRGIPFILLPTTLLAMADASVGGKCAVNTPVGKNIIGNFALPMMTVMDLDTLGTLPEREYRCGLAEILKLGFVVEERILPYFDDEKTCGKVLKREPETLARLLTLAVQTKLALVQEDFRDNGRRMLLNYGHTYGHAIEKLSDFAIPHGEAVALGIRLAAEDWASLSEGGTEKSSEQWVEKQNDLLNRIGMPALETLGYSYEEIMQAAASDKKNKGQVMRFVYSLGPGEGKISEIPKKIVNFL